jgi:hypothetical protein
MRRIYGGALIVLLVYALTLTGGAYENSFPYRAQFVADGIDAVLDINSSRAVWFDRNDSFPSGKTTYSAKVDLKNSTAGAMVGEIWFFIDLAPNVTGPIAIPWIDDFIDESTKVDVASVSDLGGRLYEFNAYGLSYAYIRFNHGAVAIIAPDDATRGRMMEILFFERKEYPSSSFLKSIHG